MFKKSFTINILVMIILMTVQSALGMPQEIDYSSDQTQEIPNPEAPAVYDDLKVTVGYPQSLTLPAGSEMPPKQQAGFFEGIFGSDEVVYEVPFNDDAFDRLPLARVDSDPVTIGYFKLALLPKDLGEGKVVTVEKQDPMQILNRLIGTKLIVHEGLEMGLDKLPELENIQAVFERETLREHVLKKALSEAKEDEGTVEQIYRQFIQESKLLTISFSRQELADKFVDNLKAGMEFVELAEKAVAEQEGSLVGGIEGNFFRHADMEANMAKAIENLKPGENTGVLNVDKDFLVTQLIEDRFPDNPHAKQEARKAALNVARKAKLTSYLEELTNKYLEIDWELLKSMDFSENAEPLLEDNRVIAEVKGAQPITVAQVAKRTRDRYFHGYQRAIDSGKIDDDKFKEASHLFKNAILTQEALALGLDQDEKIQREIQTHEDKLIFGAYLQKVVVPDLKITPGDFKDYYSEHRDEFTSPEMFQFRSLVFANAIDANNAFEKLKLGTDIGWLVSNASGQAAEDSPGLLDIGGRLLVTDSLPAVVSKNLANSEAGDVFTFENRGLSYVVVVEKKVASTTRSLVDVQEEVSKAVFGQKMQEGVQRWVEKLRTLATVAVFVKEFSTTQL